MERPVDYVQLMLPPQLVEPHGIAGNPNGEVGVLLWMIHGIDEQGLLQDIDVKMESAAVEVAIQNISEIGDAFLRVLAQGRRHDGKGDGNPVLVHLSVRQLSHGVQGSQGS